MSSFDKMFDLFYTESEKLENQVNQILSKSDLSVAEIIETYYQIMNVSSIMTMLNQKLDDKNEYTPLFQKIQETENFISEKFNSELHPYILKTLSDSIENTVKILQSNFEKKTKDDIEKESKIYEKLRQTMSAKEFVEQYAKGLSHD